MKFSKTLEDELSKVDVPEEWRHAAISYKSLKKIINGLVNELRRYGLSADIIKMLLHPPPSTLENGPDGYEPRLEYDIQGNSKNIINPKIKLFVKGHNFVGAQFDNQTESSLNQLLEALMANGNPINRANEVDEEGTKVVEIELENDSIFFGELINEIGKLDQIQVAERKKLNMDIISLKQHLDKTVESKFKRAGNSKMYIWRSIFRIYLDARIFFDPQDTNKPVVPSAAVAQERYRWFLDQSKKEVKKKFEKKI